MKKRIVWTAMAALLVMVLLAELTACGNGSSQKDTQGETAAAGRTMNSQPDVPDGTYRTEVSMKDQADGVSVLSPATVIIKDGQATAVLVWNGGEFEAMKVGDKKVEPVAAEGGSTFRIPVPVFDEAFVVTVTLAAEAETKEVSYSLTVSSAGLQENVADLDEELAADKEASEKAAQTGTDSQDADEEEAEEDKE